MSFGSDSTDFRLGASYVERSSCTIWADPSPLDNCTRQSGSRSRLRPSVSLSTATAPSKVTSAGRSPWWRCMFGLLISSNIFCFLWVYLHYRVRLRVSKETSFLELSILLFFNLIFRDHG